MCGIYGIVDLNRLTSELSIAAPTLLRGMAARLVHRGPDDEGSIVAPGVAIGMRRLAIIDVAGGHQPISNEDESLHVICNGEIYNYRELGAELARAGHRFKTRSDAEVLLHLYEEYGDDFVVRLNGMFAFALWDSNRHRVLIGRDRLGIKPLYYATTNTRLIFASEAKALLTTPGISAEPDTIGLSEYLALGYVPAPYSMFRGVLKLPPASLMICEDRRITIRRYWRPRHDPDVAMSEHDWVEAFVHTMERAIVSQMVSDVPLGAFLSGGVDSSTIVAFMARNSSTPIKTYSIGFLDNSGARHYNELPWARQVARLFGTEHRQIFVKPDVAALLPRLIWHLDEPVADSAFITTYLVAEFARRDVTVILSGVGGDELFGGYHRYLASFYDRYYNLLPQGLRRAVVQPLARALPCDRHHRFLNIARQLRTYVLSHDESFEERYRAYVEVFSRADVRTTTLRASTTSPFDALGAAFADVPDGDPLSRMCRTDLLTQLPDDLLLLTDRMTMATSVECRVPFLDNTLIDLSLRMPSHFKIRGRELKYVLKRALNSLLPSDILHRRKRGFGAPIGAWFKKELAPLVRHVLSRESVESRGLLRWDAVKRTIALHDETREDHTDHLLALLNLELWCQIYLDRRSPDELSERLAISATR